MPISPEDHEIPSDYNRAVPVSRAGLLPNHDIRVVLERLEKFRGCLFPELSQPILLRFYLRVGGANHVEGNLHRLGSRFQADQLLLLLFCHLEIRKHLCLLLVKHLLALLLKHLPWAVAAIPHSLFVVDCRRMVILTWGYEAVLLTNLVSVDLIPIFLLYTLLIEIFILQIRMVRFLVDFPRRILLEGDPFAILSRAIDTFRL